MASRRKQSVVTGREQVPHPRLE